MKTTTALSSPVPLRLSLCARRRGSALLTVVMLTAMMAILTASMLRYTMSERRGNERNRLILRAKNQAENIALYSAEQLIPKLNRMGTAPVGVFPWSGASANRIYMPPAVVLDSAFTSNSVGMEMRAGIESATPYALVNDITSPNTGRQVSTPKVPIFAKATATHSSMGSVTAYAEQDMQLSLTPLFQFGIFYNMDLEFFPGQNMTIAGPVHTNGRLMARGEQGGSATVTFTDRVTTAQGLYADGQIKATYVKRPGSTSSGAGGTGAVYYSNTSGSTYNLQSSGGVWRDHKYGTSTETTTTVNQFETFATSTYGGNVRSSAHGVSKLELPGIGSYQETDDPSTTEDERDNGRQLIEPRDPFKWNGTSWAATTDDAATKELKIARKAGLYIVVNPDDTVRTGKLPDGGNVTMLARSYRCWLNIINSDATHTLREVVLPGQPAYGYNDGGTPGSTPALTADDSMYQNLLPNRYTSYTSVGPNQVLRIPMATTAGGPTNVWDAVQTIVPVPAGTPYAPNPASARSGYITTGGSGDDFPAETATQPYPAEAYFFDLRRANGNVGYNSNIAGGSARGSTNYVPRAIAKIDFDLARFKMMISRAVSGATTSTGYNVDVPVAGNWANSIYNHTGAPASLGLGMDDNNASSYSYTVFPAGGTAAEMNRMDPFQLHYTPAYLTPATPDVIPADPRTLVVPSSHLASAWYDGIAIYIHSVDAERRAQTAAANKNDRIDSGVRLWNGRGPLATLATSGRTGFTFATNDAAYIVGHYNADGAINATSTASGYGGYSARYPDSADEKLASVLADGITLISQPVFTNASSPYYQTNGWNDAVSAFRITSSSWSATWDTAAPSSSSQYEGLGASATSIRPGALPTSSTPGAGGSTRNTKLPTVTTEFSTALLMGLVPSSHNATGLTDRPPIGAANAQYSGGAHNFPRLLEDWHNDMGSGTVSGTTDSGLYIRGSMVALFESRVAMEPWNIRCYAAPLRYWGLHQDFRTANHDVPLEPIVIGADRLGFRELSAADYAARKTYLESLTLIP